MGTDKRARQKANRQRGLAELQKQQAAQQRKRQFTRFALAGLAGVAVILVLVYAVGGKSTNTSSTTTAADVTTVDPNAASTVPPAPPVCPNADGSSARTISFTKAPLTCINSAKTYTALVETNQGSYTIALDAGRAPMAVNNFVFLARYHYFDATPCHRIVAGFVVQCGDPTGTGNGGPGYTFRDELPKTASDYKAGSVAMANSGVNTNGSQFFVVLDSTRLTKPAYTLFGQVTDGLDTTVKKLESMAGDAATDGVPTKGLVTIAKVTITES